MIDRRSLSFFLAAVFLLGALIDAAAAGKSKMKKVAIPEGIRHEQWEALLRKYVNERGLVDYQAWKNNEADRRALDDYLAQFAVAGNAAAGDEMAASAINAYNATAIRLILENYPTESIQELPNAFGRRLLETADGKVSLDDLENGTLRPKIGWRTHAALVCCGRSCPPLQRFAYTGAELNRQIDAAYSAWLGRNDLNRFMPEKNKVKISSIFKWYQDDFEKAGGVKKILAQYSPQKFHDFLQNGDYEIDYLPYNWGLNDQGERGKNYSRLNLIWDKITETFVPSKEKK